MVKLKHQSSRGNVSATSHSCFSQSVSPMSRNLSPIVRRELENLDKDAESRKMAIKALKTYVKDLDSKAIPQFLAQVSESKTPTFSSGEHTISLYEVLARVHGPNIVPQIDNIMSTILKTLTSSAGSFPLQQACSKVVPAIARYAIEPTAPEDKKRFIIHSLCKPLLDNLLGTQESLAFGAALCLKSLVESDNWRFASDEIVNEVCLRVAGALEENPTQTNSHMGLVMALAKRNNFTVEAYARSLIRSGLRILDSGAVEGNSQKKLSAIQMVNFLMKSVDPRSIFSELPNVVDVLEKCHNDKMPFVRGAAFEALQTAKMLASDKGSVTGSNFGRRDQSRRKDYCNGRVRSPLSLSPESQTIDSFSEYGSLVESPTSTGQVSCNFEYGGRLVNRKLWRNDTCEVDVSLKDGLYSEAGSGPSGSNGSNRYFEGFEDGEVSDFGREDSEVFSGFGHATSREEGRQSTTPSPQRTHSQLDYDAIKIYTTPRKLLHSLQNLNDENSDFSENSATRIRSQVSGQLVWRSPARKLDLDGNDFSDKFEGHLNDNDIFNELREQETNSFESESSMSDIAHITDAKLSNEVSQKDKCGIQNPSIQKMSLGETVRSCIRGFVGIFIVLVATILLAMLMHNQEEGINPIPT